MKRILIVISLIVAATAASAAPDVPAAAEQRTEEAATALALMEYCDTSGWKDDRDRFIAAERQRGLDESQMAFIVTYLGALQSRDRSRLMPGDCTAARLDTARQVLDELASGH